MIKTCKECQGLGLVIMGAYEDSYVCCEGMTVHCDSCHEEFDCTDDPIVEQFHFCDTCLERSENEQHI